MSHYVISPQPGLTLLVFPPVWVPIVPHLALPVLSSYLKSRGLPVVAVDANVEFFTNYLFNEATISGILDGAKELGWRGDHAREGCGSSGGLSMGSRGSGDCCSPSYLKSVLQKEETFFSPRSAVGALMGLHEIMGLMDLIYKPARISFNYYKRGDIWEEKDLLAVCEDERRNIFLPFWRDRFLPLVHELQPLCVGISISTVHQFVASMTLARLLRKEVPWIHIVVGGKHLSRIEGKVLKNGFFFRDYFHSAVIEDGELPLVGIIESLKRGKSPEGVPGVITWENGGPRYSAPVPPPPWRPFRHRTSPL